MNRCLRLFILLFVLTFSFALNAATVAVVDSGTDFAHLELSDSAWINTGEIVDNWLDDDSNGMIDDIHGWNFIDDFNNVFVRQHLSEIHPVAYDILSIISRAREGRISAEEQTFFERNFENLPEDRKNALIEHMGYLGQYAHGTHVAGIVSDISPNADILSARVFPDSAPVGYEHQPENFSMESKGPIADGITTFFYKLLSMISNQSFYQVSDYLLLNQIDVANYSLGVNFTVLARLALQLKGNESPTEEELAAEVQKMYSEFKPKGLEWMRNSPGTLFVIAAGNEGLNNDVFPAFPASVRADNAISVAASYGYEKLAEFSNYGSTSVDVAAPGVTIESAVPHENNEMRLPLSGTSMAAPFVAGVAGNIKDQNQELSAEEIRMILISTVDKKDWLRDKVFSSGVVNAERAKYAAKLTRTMSVADAVAQARLQVNDVAVSFKEKRSKVRLSDELRALSKSTVF